MMKIYDYAISLLNPATNTMVANLSKRAFDIDVSIDALTFRIRALADEPAVYLDNPPALHAIVRRSDGKRFIYRLNTPALEANNILSFECFNLIACLDDDEACVEWSTMDDSKWLPVGKERVSNRAEELHEFGSEYPAIYPKKNEKFSVSFIGSKAIQSPSGATRKQRIIQCDFEFRAPTNWTGVLQRSDASFGFIARILTITGSGAGAGTIVNGALCEAFTDTDIISMDMWYDAALALYAGETGDVYFRIKNWRVAASSANMVNTVTITAAITAGANRTVTPASMANIYVGQRLVFESTTSASGAVNSESVVVKSKTATTFVADFTKNHAIGSTVKGIVITDKEIIEDALANLRTLNPNCGLSAAKMLIVNSGEDQEERTWINESYRKVLDDLAVDTDYVYGVDREGRVYYRPRGTYARAWASRRTRITMKRPLDKLYNSVRAAYQNAKGVLAQTAYSVNSVSALLYGIVRRKTVKVDTTNATLAANARTFALNDSKNRNAQIDVVPQRLTDMSGGVYPLDEIEPGDTITITDLPASFGEANLRKFVVAEQSINATSGQGSITPQEPIPTIESYLANLTDIGAAQDTRRVR
ncbi:hypothetical protein [Herpetosiphon geysericola]|uniref:Uncharacterized protein n=1 Tax=Herpetosiphon geysericola TaxID=70996 RepID=A0A0P6YJU6_9CHLR|nr:hypothetical protein [Herpetosiphon geysericola]KPL89999.1 hypothetical protein SE18_08585 [Herpetosiphon geysericola]